MEAIPNALLLRAVADRANRPSPTADDVILKAKPFAFRGDYGMGWVGKLPPQTIAELTQLGFAVEPDGENRHIKWGHDSTPGVELIPARGSKSSKRNKGRRTSRTEQDHVT